MGESEIILMIGLLIISALGLWASVLAIQARAEVSRLHKKLASQNDQIIRMGFALEATRASEREIIEVYERLRMTTVMHGMRVGLPPFTLYRN